MRWQTARVGSSWRARLRRSNSVLINLPARAETDCPHRCAFDSRDARTSALIRVEKTACLGTSPRGFLPAPFARFLAISGVLLRERRERFEERSEEVRVLSDKSAELPTGRKMAILYADPATRYVSGFVNRSIENHYRTMSIDELCALPVGDTALPKALLLIWSTVPQLANTITRIIPAWGFAYASSCMWDKTAPDHPDQAATGHWFRNQHEILIAATRGSFPAPVKGWHDIPLSIHREAKREHGRKPEYYYEMIEAIWPNLPKLELFARNRRPGWEEPWGNQIPDDPCDETPPIHGAKGGKLVKLSATFSGLTESQQVDV
jgi:N6-adenosine-specific RNA methylase IME4